MDVYEYINCGGEYDIIYADPPWSYKNKNCSGACERHYGTLSINDLCNLDIGKISSENCILFLWATYPLLPEGLKLIESWGFKYKTIAFQWVKLNKSGNGKFFGLGNWTRGNTEPCLLATKGRPKRTGAAVSQLIEHPLGQHSAKPPSAREKIVELMGNKSRIELFAREKVKGWHCLGNEIDGKDVRDIL